MATQPSPGSPIRFEDFELDVRSGELRRRGELLKLQPQPSKILTLLASRRGEVVSRNDIAREVWGSETFVDFERGLNFAISQIRTVLGDDAEQPRFIETVPKRGYRFIAPLKEQSPDATARVPTRRPVKLPLAIGAVIVALIAAVAFFAFRGKPQAAPRPIVLAVLPFDDLSGEPQPFLVSGLTEEMIARVTQISPEHVKVIARTSAMQYERTKKNAREIGQELGADYVLENSIRHENGHIRITSQLVRTADQTHLWAENYDRDMRELLPLEGDVTASIAEQVQRELLPSVAITLPGSGRPVSPEAHELYLKGRYYFNARTPADLRQSVTYFQQAILKQPDYAAAYAALADADNLIAFYGFDPTMNSVGQAKVAALKALQLDDSMSAAHAALAYTEFMWQEDWASADKEFRRALQLDDNDVPAHHWYALYLAANGRMDQSVQQMRYALKLDPLSATTHLGMAYVYYFARDYQQAAQQAAEALQLNASSMAAHAVLGWVFTEQKRFPDAIQNLQTAIQLSGGVQVYQCGLARAYALSGNAVKAREVLAKAETMQEQQLGTGTSLASVYVALGDSESALHWLEQTAPGDIQANWLRVDPAFDALRQFQRFAAVQRRIGVKTSQP